MPSNSRASPEFQSRRPRTDPNPQSRTPGPNSALHPARLGPRRPPSNDSRPAVCRGLSQSVTGRDVRPCLTRVGPPYVPSATDSRPGLLDRDARSRSLVLVFSCR